MLLYNYIIPFSTPCGSIRYSRLLQNTSVQLYNSMEKSKNRLISFEEKYQSTAKIQKSLRMTMKTTGIIAMSHEKSFALSGTC